MKKFVTLALLAFATFAFAQTENRIQAHETSYYETHSTAHTYTDDNGMTLPYRLFLPPGYDAQKQYPLVLSFHGAGSRGDDNLKQLRPWIAGWMDEQAQDENPCIILMPQCPKKCKWVNVDWTKGSYIFKDVAISDQMKLAKAIFDKVVEEEAVDKSRIYVMGASMGGYATWNFVMRYHKLIAAAVPICAAGDPSMAKKIRKVPIWAFHGDVDPTVPLSGSTDMITALQNVKKTDVHLTIYEGVKHNSYEQAWNEPELIKWVFSQTK